MRTWMTLMAVVCVAMGICAARGAATPRVEVDVTGTVHAGVMAIGGETTGYTITEKASATAGEKTYELDFGDNKEWKKLAESLDGKAGHVVGGMVRKKGVEVGERFIIYVTTFEKAGDGAATKPGA